MLIHAARLLRADDRLAEGWVRVEGATVHDLQAGPPPAGVATDLTVDLLVPGFVDVHCHGGGGASFTSGSAEEAAHAAETHARHGTTTVVASLVSDTVAALDGHVRVLRDLVEDGVLAGIHLEGPWLSPRFAGAHDPSVLTAPNPADLDHLLDAGGGAIRMVTLAPELPGALDAVRRLTGADVVAAVGHTDTDASGARAAFDVGASQVTHLFNAMRAVHHRDPGPVPVALTDPRVGVELIADGVHLDPSVLALAARAATGGFLLVSDAMAAAAAPDGDYRLGRLDVTVASGVARLAGTGSIAGSTLTLDRAVVHAVDAGVPLEAALAAATRIPAARVGLVGRGVLAPGARADLVALDDHLHVVAVMRAGRWFRRPV